MKQGLRYLKNHGGKQICAILLSFAILLSGVPIAYGESLAPQGNGTPPSLEEIASFASTLLEVSTPSAATVEKNPMLPSANGLTTTGPSVGVMAWARTMRTRVQADLAGEDPLTNLFQVMELAKGGGTNRQATKDYVKSYLLDEEGHYKYPIASGSDKDHIQATSLGICAVRALGYDPKQYYGIDLVAELLKVDSIDYIYALTHSIIALSSDDYGSAASAKATTWVEDLIGRQEADGLWRLNGNYVESTGYALQALSGFYASHAGAKAAVEKTVDALSLLMGDNGDLSSAGDTNPTIYKAMILSGLWSNSLSYLSDARLMKNGVSLLDGLRLYDGGNYFKRGIDNPRGAPWATESGFRALMALDSMEQGKGGVFYFSEIPSAPIEDVFYDVTFQVLLDSVLQEGYSYEVKVSDTDSVLDPKENGYKLKAGSYDVTVKKTGYPSVTQTVVVSQDQTISIDIPLYNVTFQVSEDGVFTEGYTFEVKDPVINSLMTMQSGVYRLRSGKYEVTANKEESESIARIVTVDEDGAITLYVGASAFLFDAETGTILGYVTRDVPTDLVIPQTISGVQVKTIASNAFNYRSGNMTAPLVTLTLPEGLEFIGEDAFRENGLTSLTLPESLKELGRWSFCKNAVDTCRIKSTQLVFNYTNWDSVSTSDAFNWNKAGKFTKVITPANTYHWYNLSAVINPVTVHVRYINKDTDEIIKEEDAVGQELKKVVSTEDGNCKIVDGDRTLITDYTVHHDGVWEYLDAQEAFIKNFFMKGKEFTLQPEHLLGYDAPEAVVKTFSADTDSVDFYYQPLLDCTLTLKGEGITSSPAAGALRSGTQVNVQITTPEKSEIDKILINGVDRKSDFAITPSGASYSFKIAEDTFIEPIFKSATYEKELSLQISKPTLFLGEAGKLQLVLRGVPVTLPSEDIVWTPSPAELLDLDTNIGEVTALSSGTFTLTAALKANPNVKDTVTFAVKPVTVRLRIESSNMTVLPATDVILSNVKLDPYYSSKTFLRPTALHAIVKALEENQSITGIDPKNRKQFTLGYDGDYISSIRGENDSGLGGWMYYIDNAWVDRGISNRHMKNGESIVLWRVLDYTSTTYTWYEPEDYRVQVGKDLTVSMVGNFYDMSHNSSTTGPVKGATLLNGSDPLLKSDGTPYVTDAQGQAVLRFGKAGVYHLSGTRSKEDGGLISRPYAKVIVTEEPVVEEDVYEVQVTTDPVDAKVTITNENGRGILPISGKFRLKAGKYNINASKDNYEDASVEWTVTEDAATHQVRLTLKMKELPVGQIPTVEEAIARISAKMKSTIAKPEAWIVIGLARSGEKDVAYLDRYYANLVNELKGSGGKLGSDQSTEYEKAVIALTAIGKNPQNVAGYNLLEPIANLDKAEKQGVNALVFALIALDTHDWPIPKTKSGTQATRENIIQKILAKQCPEGGWAYSGDAADPDMTAMAITALAPYVKQRDVQTAIDRALKEMSQQQTATAGFKSWGTENSNSIEQMITALSALGRDAETDPQFLKNGRHMVQELLEKYYAPDDGFKYLSKDAQSNGMSTEQGLYALAAYQRMKNHQRALYDMRDVEIAMENPVVKTPMITIVGAKDQQGFNTKEISVSIKAMDYQNKALVPHVYFNEQELMSSNEMYKLSFVQEQNILKVIAEDTEGNREEQILHLLYFPSASDDNDTPPVGTNTVTFSIDKETIGKGYVMEPTKVELRSGDSVWDVFRRAATKRGISFQYKFYNQYNSVYIESIDGDGEFDHGDGSGWMYNVNGTYPQVGASLYYPKAGDVIQWRYTTNLGEDIGGGMGVGGEAGLRKSLKEYIDTAKAFHKNEYTQTSYDALQEALKEAEAIYFNQTADKHKIHSAMKKLTDAIKGMERLGVEDSRKNYRNDLQKKVEQLRALKSKLYEEKSFDALQKTLQKAEEILKREDASEEDLKAALTQLQEAYDKLKALNGEKANPLEEAKLLEKEKLSEETALPKETRSQSQPGDYARSSHPKYLAEFGETLEEVDLGHRYKDHKEIASWAASDVLKARSYHLMIGDKANKFHPKQAVTRAEIAAIVSNLFANTPYERQENRYNDVAKDKWYYEAVEKVSALGIMTGTGEDNFAPEAKITREQFAMLLQNLQNYDESVAKTPKDIDKASAGAKEAVERIYGSGLMTGHDGNFRPKDEVTREMAASILVKLYEEQFVYVKQQKEAAAAAEAQAKAEEAAKVKAAEEAEAKAKAEEEKRIAEEAAKIDAFEKAKATKRFDTLEEWEDFLREHGKMVPKKEKEPLQTGSWGMPAR